jgi:hypothetical protein
VWNTGRSLSLPTANDGEVESQFFGSGNFRVWDWNDTATGTQDILVDGSKVQDYTPAYYSKYNGDANSLKDLGAEGLHSIKIERDNTTNPWYFTSIDYHAPVFNQFYNLANPFPDYLFGQTGVLDNRKFTAYDEMPDKRVIELRTLLADGTGTALPLHIASICVDFEKVNIEVNTTWYNNVGAVSNGNVLTYVDTERVKDGVNGGANGAYVNISSSKEVNLKKRVRITFSTLAVSANWKLETSAGIDINTFKVEER